MAVAMIKHTFRVLSRDKQFVVLAISSLGAAIAFCSIVFGLFDAMWRPRLAITSPGDLREVTLRTSKLALVDRATFNAQLGRLATVRGTAGAVIEANQFVTIGEHARSARVLRVSPGYFALLGVKALYGRLLGEADADDGGRPVVVSERLWRQLFPAASALGAVTIRLHQEQRPIVGVIPLESDFPGANTDVWQLELPSKPVMHTLVRRRHDASEAELHAELKLLAAQLSASLDERIGATFRIRPKVEKPFGLLSFHYALISAAAAVFLVACFNLANIQLARGLRRAPEFATLSALGATRVQLIAQVMGETTAVTVGGLAIGTWLTTLGVRIVRAATPSMFGSFLIQPQVSWRVFAFSLAVGVGASLLFGLLPALRLSQADIHQALKSGTRALDTHRVWNRVLIVCQVSLALSLVAAASLLTRTVLRLKGFDIGASIPRLVDASMSVRVHHGEVRGLSVILADLRAMARSELLVEDAATATIHMPLNHTISVARAGALPQEINVGTWQYRAVSATYLRVLGSALVSGSPFVDEPTGPSVLVDARTAAWLWPGISPMDGEVKLGDARSGAPWLRVVGVVEPLPSLANADRSEARVPGLGQIYVFAATDSERLTRPVDVQLLVRSTSPDSVVRLSQILERRLRDSGMSLENLNVGPWRTQQYLSDWVARQSFVAGLFATFALLATLLAALGVYAMCSQHVALAKSEFAVRVALGAPAAGIRAMVVREARVLVLLGIAFGLGISGFTVDWLTAYVRSEGDRHDPLAYGLVGLAVFLAMSVVSHIPARRAVPGDVMRALAGL